MVNKRIYVVVYTIGISGRLNDTIVSRVGVLQILKRAGTNVQGTNDTSQVSFA